MLAWAELENIMNFVNIFRMKAGYEKCIAW